MSSCANADASKHDANATSAMGDSGIGGVGNDSENPNINMSATIDTAASETSRIDENRNKHIKITNNVEKETQSASLNECASVKIQQKYDTNRPGLTVKIAAFLREHSQEKNKEKLQSTISTVAAGNSSDIGCTFLKNSQIVPVKLSTSPTYNYVPPKVLSVPKIMITSPPPTESNDHGGRCSINLGTIADTSKTIGESSLHRHQRLEDVKRLLSNKILIRKINPTGSPSGTGRNMNQDPTLTPSTTQIHQHQHQLQQQQFLQTTNLLNPPSANSPSRKRNISPNTNISNSTSTSVGATTSLPMIKVRKLHTITEPLDQRICLPSTSAIKNSPKSQLTAVRFPIVRPISFSASHKLQAGAIVRPVQGLTSYVIRPVQYENYYPTAPNGSPKMHEETKKLLIHNLPTNPKSNTKNEDSNALCAEGTIGPKRKFLFKQKAPGVPVVLSNVTVPKTPVVTELQTSSIKEHLQNEKDKMAATASDISKSKNTQNYAFILENKLLNQDEKIDLTKLRLENAKITDKHSRLTFPLPIDEIKKEKLDEVDSQSSSTVVKKKRLIVSNAKLKLTSKDEIAAMAKMVIQNAAKKNTIATGSIPNSAVSAVRAQTQTKNMPQLNSQPKFSAPTKPTPKKLSTLTGKDLVEKSTTKTVDETIKPVPAASVRTLVELEPKSKSVPGEIDKETDMKTNCSTSNTSPIKLIELSVPPASVAPVTLIVQELQPKPSSSNVTKDSDIERNCIKPNPTSTVSVGSNLKLAEKLTLPALTLSKDSLPKASLHKKTIISKDYSMEKELIYREKILSFCDSMGEPPSPVKEYPTIEVVEILGDEDEEDDEIDAVDFIASLSSFGQNTTPGSIAIKAESTADESAGGIGISEIKEYATPKMQPKCIENTVNTDREDQLKVHESKAPDESNIATIENTTTKIEKQYAIESKQPHDSKENVDTSITQVASLHTNKEVKNQLPSCALSLTDTPNPSEQSLIQNPSGQMKAKIEKPPDASHSEAPTDKPKASSAPAPTSRKRIGIRNAPINLVSRKKPMPTKKNNLTKAKHAGLCDGVTLSDADPLPISSEQTNNQSNELLGQKKLTGTAPINLDLNVNVIENLPNTHTTPTVIKTSASDVAESLQNVAVEPLTSIPLGDQLLEVETMQNDLDILATLSVAQQPLCVAPKSPPSVSGVPALGTIIDMKAYGLEQSNINTEIIIKNDETTSKQVSVVTHVPTDAAVMNNECLNIPAKSRSEKIADSVGLNESSNFRTRDENLKKLAVVDIKPISTPFEKTQTVTETGISPADEKTTVNCCKKLPKVDLQEMSSGVFPDVEASKFSLSNEKCQALSTIKAISQKNQIHYITERGGAQKVSLNKIRKKSSDKEANPTNIPFIDLNKNLEHVKDPVELTSISVTSQEPQMTSEIACTQNAKVTAEAKSVKRVQHKVLKKIPLKFKNIKLKRRCVESQPGNSKYFNDNEINDRMDAVNTVTESKAFATVTCSSDEIIPCSISESSDSQLNVSFLNRRRLYRKRRGVPKMFSTSESEAEENQPTPLAKLAIGLIESISETSSDEIKAIGKPLAATSKSTTELTEKLEPQFASPFVPLKKRWELSQQQQKRTLDETDITDDTSPALDEDDDDRYNKAKKEIVNKQLKLSENTTGGSIKRIAHNTKQSVATITNAQLVSEEVPNIFFKPNTQIDDSKTLSTLSAEVKVEETKSGRQAKKNYTHITTSEDPEERQKSQSAVAMTTSADNELDPNDTMMISVTHTEISTAEIKTTHLRSDLVPNSAAKLRGRKSKNKTALDDPLSLIDEIPESSTTPAMPKKRGRPRKSIVVSPLNESVIDLISRPRLAEGKELLISSTPKSKLSRLSSPDFVEKKRARISLQIEDTEDSKKEAISTTTVMEVSTPKPATKTRNRNRGPVGDFNPRMLLMCRREQLNSDEPLTVPEHAAGAGPLQCGLCLARTTQNNWQKHMAEHYGIGWIVGESNPVDVTTRNTVLTQVQSFLKNSSISSLSCRLCQRTYRSNLGLILHLESCGEAPQRVVCPHCGNNYTKLSMVVHQRSCTGRKQTVQSEEANANDHVTEKNPHFDGRLKRVSSIKAERKLKTLTQDLSQEETVFLPQKFVKQFENVGAKEQPNVVFVCTICGNTKPFTTKAGAIKHVVNKHKPETASGQPAPVLDFESDGFEPKCGNTLDEDESEDYTSGLASSSLDSECIYSGKESSKKKKNRSLASNRSHTATYNKIYSPRCTDVPAFTQQMWKEFINKNFSKTELFEKFRPNVDTLNISNEALEKLLPIDKCSLKFTIPRKLKMFVKFGESASGTLEWQTLQRFQETTATATDKLVYVGAPIKLLLWIPLPPEIHEQYLILAYRKSSTSSSHVRLLNTRPKQTLLFVYKVNIVDNRIQSELHYALHIPNGPIHTVAFLPSGGYDASINRLGLIAIGGVQSSIRVYSMPIDPTTAGIAVSFVQNSSNIRAIRLSTAFELVLNPEIYNDEVETQVLHICWSEFLGHEHIFASFSNGYIAVWKMHEPRVGSLNTYYYERENGDRCYTPENYFSFEESRVCGLAIHYDTYGPRWLLAYAASRNLCVFDIRDKTQPKTIKEECLKHVPRCIDWNPIWETFSVGTCDIIPNYGRVLSIYNPVGVNFMHLSLVNSLGGISQVHYNPWQSVTLFATDNGDMCCVDTAELNVDFKKSKRLIALSIMDMKRVDSNELLVTGSGIQKVSNVSFPIVDKASKEQEKSYGVVFSTFSRLLENETNMLRDEKRKPPSSLERHTRINAVRWNLNVGAKNLLAVGYENGFLRLCTFKRDAYFNKA